MAYQLLLADDSATMQKVVQITFGNEDSQVTAVDNGQAAIATAKQMKPQLALVDVGMPGMDGYAVCQAIKADAETQNIPVVLLASNFAPIDEARAQSVGATAHVMKPFETQALIDRVKTILGAPITAAVRSIPAASAAPAARPAAATAPPPVAQAQAAAGGFGAPGFGQQPRPQVSQTQAPPSAPPGLATGQPARPAAPPATPFGAPPRPAPQPAANPFAPGAPASSTPQRTPPAFGSPPAAAPPQQARPTTPAAPPPRPFGAAPQASPASVARPATPAAPPAAAKANEASFGDVQLDLGDEGFGSPPQQARPFGAAPPAVSSSPASPPQQARPPASSFGAPPQQSQSRDPFGLGQTKPAQPPAAPAPQQAQAPVAAQRPAAAGMPAELAGMNEEMIRAVAREVIERVAWEIVPELAETIIRQHLDKLIKGV